MVLLPEKLHLYYEDYLRWSDPLVAHLPLMVSPLPVVTILTAYLLFVLKIGPSLMKTRQPYNLSNVIMVYNILQILVNVYITYLGLRYIPEVNIYCVPTGHAGIALGEYIYLWVKIFDLLDTFFFVLRKKYNQISFLHLYHHVIMVVLTWSACKYVPGGQVYFVGCINGFVHIIMYIYYFLTNWNPAYKANIWWKRHVTEIQIVQHFMIFLAINVALLNPNCTFPKMFLAVLSVAAALMIKLFVNFYINAYVKKAPTVTK